MVLCAVGACAPHDGVLNFSLMMGLWLATSFIGNLIAGWLGGLWTGMDSAKFFLMIAAFAAAAGVATAFFIRPLKPILER
jgi:POT family proton-dependent oligopeptide transporter